MASKEIRVPDLGDFKDVAVIDVLVQPGQSIEVDTPLVTLETEKATMDVPSTEAGVIERVHVSKGGRVSAGSLVATLRAAESAASPANAGSASGASTPSAPRTGGNQRGDGASAASAPRTAAAGPAAATPPRAGAKAAAAPADADGAGTSETPPMPPQAGQPADQAALPAELGALGSGSHASPSVRKFARELGVDLGHVRGTGQKGRITADDVKAFVKGAMSRGAGAAGEGWPTVVVPDFAQFGPIEIKPLGRVQRISGPRVHASWVNLPHVTQFDEADITELEAVRTQLKSRAEAASVKLTLLSFIVLACVRALQKYPQFNTSLDESGQNLIYKKYLHIGFAADTPQGLLVPVIRDANRKDIYETARVLGELSERARAGKLGAAEMQGGSFTISSLGGIGGTAFTPIINAPEVAILGVSRATTRPVFHEGGFVPRLILPLSLSYDHRVIDGVAGARFVTELGAILGQPKGLIEAVP